MYEEFTEYTLRIVRRKQNLWYKFKKGGGSVGDN